MCFSVNVNIIKEELENRYGAGFTDHDNYRPSYYYHAYSLPEMPVLRRSGSNDDIQLFTWGLIPSWTEDADEAERIRYMTFNARAETISEKPSFRNSFKTNRCIIPVRGFFEWQHIQGQKRPWFIFIPGEPIMSVGGIYDRWIEETSGNSVLTFSVITTAANAMMEEIHNTRKRMPLIINDDESLQAWLNPDTGMNELNEIMKPLPEGILDAYTVSPVLNNNRINHNNPATIKPFVYPEQKGLF